MYDSYTYTSDDLKIFLSECTEDKLKSICHDIYMTFIDKSRRLNIIISKPLIDIDNDTIIIFDIKLPITMFLEQDIIIDKLIENNITKEQIFEYIHINTEDQIILDKILVTREEINNSTYYDLKEKYGHRVNCLFRIPQYYV